MVKAVIFDFDFTLGDSAKGIALSINYALENNFYLNNLTFSPIKGKKEGNIEFLALFSRFSNDITLNVEDIVNEAHANLKE